MDMSTLLLLSILLLAGPLVAHCDSSVTTYNLFYDGFLAARTTAASEVSNVIANDILKLLELEENHSAALEESSNEDSHCHETFGSSRCSADYGDESVSLHVSTHLAHDSGDVRIDITLTSSNPPEVLVQTVSKISSLLGLEHDEPVWSIRHRPSALEMKKRWNDSNSVASTQEQRDLEAASLETMILEKAELRNRTRIATNASLEIWQYNDVDFKEPIRALFGDGELQTTTAPASAAHAEALVHPALIAHADPKSVLVLSRTPSVTVREVLKHKSINHVSVLGADQGAMNLIEKHMPSLVDCSFLGTSRSNCLQQEQVKIINQDVEEWIAGAVELIENEGESAWNDWYDIILVDVPVGTSAWLSLDLYTETEKLTASDDTIVVVSSGSQPSLFDVDTGNELSSRETFLHQAALPESQGGLGLSAIHVYDEALACPLSSSFIVLFPEATGSSYARFVRKNSPMIDIDMVSRLLPTTTRTVVYDGPTHVQYMVPSRAWENHYCKTSLGRDLPICQSFLQEWMDASVHNHFVDVRKDSVKGRTMYATEDIAQGRIINPQDAAFSLRMEQDQWEALNKFIEDFPEAEMYRQLRDFFVAYGFEQQELGIYGWGVSIACTNTFVNHACSEQEQNVDGSEFLYVTEDDVAAQVFSPPFTRRSEVLAQLLIASKDIKAGDELLQDYSSMMDEQNEKYRHFLQTMCEDGVGAVVDKNGSVVDEK